MFNLVNQSQLSSLTDKILEGIHSEGVKMLDFLAKQNQQAWNEVNLLFCNEEESQKLNRNFLGKDQPTDVLTFNDQEDARISGDLALCLPVIFNNATFTTAPKLSKEYVFFETLLHGFLHLYGLEHDYEEATLRSLYQAQKALLDHIQPNYRLISQL